MATIVGVRSLPEVPKTNVVGREWQEKVEALLKERRRVLQAHPEACEGLADPMDEAHEREEAAAVWVAILDCSHDVQATVEEALRRLATGEYGLCMECGHHIALARLRALPFAVRCLSCQERLERKKRRPCGGRETAGISSPDVRRDPSNPKDGHQPGCETDIERSRPTVCEA